MAEKKVVGLDNLKIFYNKLKDVFAPKLEGKNYLTSATGTEGYTTSEIDIKIKNLEDKIIAGEIVSPGGGDNPENLDLNSIQWDACFQDITPESLNDIETSGDLLKYNYFIQNSEGKYQVATIQQLESIINKDEKLFFKHPLLSYTYPGFTEKQYISNQISKNMNNLMYSSYNYGNPGYAYPNYFSYYIMEIDEQTQLPEFRLITQAEAQRLGDQGTYIFVLNYTPSDIENLIEIKIREMVKAESLNNG